jgi:DNA-binding transcriptional regulator WhiA
MARKLISQKEKDGMVELYLNGKTAEESANFYNYTTECCTRELKKRGIGIRGSTRYTIDETIFDDINTSEKAYWLGFIVADGYVSDSVLSLALSNKDEEHLKKFLLFCGSNSPISSKLLIFAIKK